MRFDLLNIRLLDILDVLIVAYLIYLIYKLLRGTIAFNIFIGVVLLYLLYFLVGFFEMELLRLLLGRFVGFGVIIVIIIFQPEIRRFLLLLGNTTVRGRLNFLNRFFGTQIGEITKIQSQFIDEVIEASVQLSNRKMGALMVFAQDDSMDQLLSSATSIDAKLSSPLLQNIFWKNSPLHDGAVIIREGRIKAASAILPVSESAHVSKELGLRHRAGIGITEVQNVFAVIISEETGEISFVKEGQLERNISIPKLKKYLHENSDSFDV